MHLKIKALSFKDVSAERAVFREAVRDAAVHDAARDAAAAVHDAARDAATAAVAAVRDAACDDDAAAHDAARDAAAAARDGRVSCRYGSRSPRSLI